MSRFDRRLKGGGLRPGQSTCKIRNAPAKVMNSGFANTKVGGSSYATAYNPIVPGVNQAMSQQNYQVQPSAPMQPQEQQNQIQKKVYISQEELGLKNRRLEQYALTAPSQEMKTLTMHEIRLNKLEWINDQAEKMMDEDETQENNLDVGKLIDAKLSTFTLTTLEPRLKKMNTPVSSITNNNDNNSDLIVKFNNLNSVSMKSQQDINTLKSDVKVIKGGIKSFATNLKGVALLKKQIETYKKEMESLRANYKKLKSDFETHINKIKTSQVQLNIDEISREKKSMEESEVRDVVVKAIKNKSVN